ncbi:hypothetical protein [Halalkalibaculum sp. DA384]|uniref:hypothetical protein n=1 Tax=Halalkalibaculum sp. DA384 TaxID=3373606 RepID=UPI003753F69A
MSFLELFELQAYLGSPVFIFAAIILVFYLKKASQVNFSSIAFVILCLIIGSIFLGVAVWGNWPFENLDVMILEFINLPALIACIINVPLCIWLFSNKEKKLV